MQMSYLVWGLAALAFLVVELLGVFHVFGWVSLSSTVWSLERAGVAVKALVLAGCFVLASHLCLGWPH